MSTSQHIFGYHAVEAILQSQPRLVQQIFLQAQRKDQRQQALQSLAKQSGVPVQLLSKADLDKQVGADVVHQGVIAICHPLPGFNENDLFDLLAGLQGPALLLILDGVQDPHNLGACLRTANAMGVHAVIAPKDRAVGLTATARKVACGADVMTPFVTVTNLARTMRALQDLGIWLIGTDADAEAGIASVDLTGSIAIVMGGEGQGLRHLTRERCDFLAHIPMSGSVSSLNVSVATAICLYEAQRRRL